MFSINQAFAFSGSGEGTNEAPYEITNCSQLQEMSNDLAASYILMNNIDCIETSSWNPNQDEWVGGIVDGELIPDSYASTTQTNIVVENNGFFGFSPVGDNNEPFTGKLDGNDKEISNLWIFRKGQNFVGLFGQAVNANIFDLKLSNSHVVGSQYTGGLVGNMEDTQIDNVTLENNMVRAYLNYYGGGLVGRSYGSLSVISNVNNIGGNVHGSGNIIGGIVGSLINGEIRDSNTSADVDGGYMIGGAIGEASQATIDNVHATGDVVSNRSEIIIMKTGYYSGGLVSYISNGTEITNSSATGSVTSDGSYTGGFVGYMSDSTITNSTSTGNVLTEEVVTNEFPNDISNVGGFVGQAFNSTISDSFTSSDVGGNADTVGGFAGSTYCGSVLTRNSSTGDVEGNDYIGGFVGFDGCMGPGSYFIEVFASGDAAGNNYVGGFGGSLFMSSTTNVYTTGDVSGNNYVGGFAGTSGGSVITNFYSSGPVSGSGETFIAGFIGEAGTENIITNSFWDGDRASSYTNSCGDEIECTGVSKKTSAEMKTQSTFTNATWDFEEIWGINSGENDGYPFLNFSTQQSTSPINLTQKNSINSRTTANNAVIRFETNVTCSILAEPSYASIGTAELIITNDEVGLGIDGEVLAGYEYRAHMNGLQVGGTYSFSFLCAADGYQDSNTISSGEFTIIENRNRSGGTSVKTRVKKLEESGQTQQAQELRQQYPNVFGTNTSNSTSSTPLTVRDLQLGMTGDDVKALQTLLISLNYSIPAGPTGYFGNQTQNALIQYQKENSIVPSIGYFGSITRAKMKSLAHPGLWW